VFGKILGVSIIYSMISVYSAGVQPGAEDGNGIQGDTLLISTVNPVIIIRQDPEIPPEVLEIEITVLENDSLINFFLQLDLSGPENRTVRLGTVTPFPLDSGGKFIFGTGEAVKKLIRVNKEAVPDSLDLIVTLRQESTAGNIIVRIESLVWRDAED
jgi:hypothetical protein